MPLWKIIPILASKLPFPAFLTLEKGFWRHDIKSRGYLNQKTRNNNAFRREIKKQKTCTVFLSSYRNTSGSLEEREMPWEGEPQASVSTAFRVLSNFHECFKTRSEHENMFSIPLENNAKKKRKTSCQFWLLKCKFSLPRAIITSTARASFVFQSRYKTRFLTNQRAYFPRTFF